MFACFFVLSFWLYSNKIKTNFLFSFSITQVQPGTFICTLCDKKGKSKAGLIIHTGSKHKPSDTEGSDLNVENGNATQKYVLNFLVLRKLIIQSEKTSSKNKKISEMKFQHLSRLVYLLIALTAMC